MSFSLQTHTRLVITTVELTFPYPYPSTVHTTPDALDDFIRYKTSAHTHTTCQHTLVSQSYFVSVMRTLFSIRNRIILWCIFTLKVTSKSGVEYWNIVAFNCRHAFLPASFSFVHFIALVLTMLLQQSIELILLANASEIIGSYCSTIALTTTDRTEHKCFACTRSLHQLLICSGFSSRILFQTRLAPTWLVITLSPHITTC